MASWLFPAIAITVGLAAAVTDLRTGRIPNRLTFFAVLAGWIGHGALGGALGLIESIAGTTVCAAVPVVVYKVSQGQGIGGGDIKLFAALGALLGPTQGLEAEFSAFLLVGLYALFRLAFLGRMGRTLLSALRIAGGFLIPSLRVATATDHASTMVSMRMGPAILLAVVTAVFLPYLTRWLPWLS